MTALHEVQDRVGRLFGAAHRNRRMILTPEGIELPVELAEPGERLVAFTLDLFIWLCATIVLYFSIVALLLAGVAGSIAITLILFIAFIVRNLYFIYFEILWRGATPGKRICGLRVIDRRGGPTESGAIVARNLTREVEVFLPLGLLLSAGAGGTFEKLSITAWLVLFAALPLFNRDRLRSGDLIAGTMVVAVPKALLLGELGSAPTAYTFSARQLGVYGAFELQVLEELLRRPSNAETDGLLENVCGRIARRIGWTDAVAPADVRPFLNAFYAAERAQLERDRLFGKVRADKHG
ncbi:MAG TPA: RDD family protein [Beijerinckiaceae bacterium]|nr:RDD family protein [Beijerinckiaceae bacterium]